MTKRVKVRLWGKRVDGSVVIDADATEGSIVGRSLYWDDGALVQESEIRNTAGGATSTTTVSGSSGVGVTLWSLVLQIPAIIKSLAALTSNGWIRNDSATLSASYWPYNKLSVDTGEELTIPTGHELLVFSDFTMDGSITLDGDLVILS